MDGILFPHLGLSLGAVFFDLEGKFVAAGWQSGSLLQKGTLWVWLVLHVPKRLKLVLEVRGESFMRCEEGLLQDIATIGRK